jgi:hypothetical protein
LKYLFYLFSRAIQKIIEELLEIRISKAFRQPVNAKLLMLPDYHDVVKKPMDLGFFYLIDHFNCFRNN